MAENNNTRIEVDFLGQVEIPVEAYWGAQTQRALMHFQISPYRMPQPLLMAFALIKKKAAQVNYELGLLTHEIATAIQQSCNEILEQKMNQQFPLDVFQTGSGTSWNMNFNEVIANRANELLGGQRGQKSPVHPNDHVNRCQSSNDVMPSAINISTRLEADKLALALKELVQQLYQKETEFANIIKLARTHLQDAVPITLAAEFSAYRYQIQKGLKRLTNIFPELEELPLGGTAVGTGLNAHPEFGYRICEKISVATGIPFKVAENRYEAISCRDAQVMLSGVLNTIAVSLMKIANDLRLLASGPRAGLAEILLPALQPGSSIMPGKVNPVIPEIVIQVAACAMGKHTAITIAGQNGPLDLQIMQPLIAYESLTAIELLKNAINALTTKCIQGLKADQARCAELIEKSLALVTPLATKIGYDRASLIARKAYETKKTVRQIVLEEGLLTAQEADEIFNPHKMLEPKS